MLSLGSFEQLHTSARRKYWNNLNAENDVLF